jgi:AAA domain
MYDTTQPEYYDHPVFDPFSDFLKTNSYKDFQTEVTRWLWSGCTGGFVLGWARSGKTFAVERLEKNLFMRDGRAPIVVRVSIPERDGVSITDTFRFLCQCANLPMSNHSLSTVLAGNFKQYLLEQSTLNNTNTIVFLIDEVQRLTARQLAPFAEIYNDFKEKKIRTMTVLIGNQQESTRLLRESTKTSKRATQGRFFCQDFEYLGLTSQQEVRDCLKQYDDLRFPGENGPTFTEYFLPEAFAKGWRLETLSQSIWETFRTYQKEHQIRSFGLQYFREVADSLITHYLKKIDPYDCDIELIEHCFVQSSLLPTRIEKYLEIPSK